MVALTLPHHPAIWLDLSEFENNKVSVIPESWLVFVIPVASSVLNMQGLRSHFALRSQNGGSQISNLWRPERLISLGHQDSSIKLGVFHALVKRVAQPFRLALGLSPKALQNNLWVLMEHYIWTVWYLTQS